MKSDAFSELSGRWKNDIYPMILVKTQLYYYMMLREVLNNTHLKSRNSSILTGGGVFLLEEFGLEGAPTGEWGQQECQRIL